MNNTYDEIQIDPDFAPTETVAINKKSIRIKNALFEHMKARGVTAIRVEFSGNGDSGQIQDVLFTGLFKEEVPSLEELKVEGVTYKVPNGMHMKDGKWVTNWETKTPTNLKDMAEEAFYAIDSEAHHDWSNNDGGQGHMIFFHDDNGDHVQFFVQENYTQTNDYFIGVE